MYLVSVCISLIDLKGNIPEHDNAHVVFRNGTLFYFREVHLCGSNIDRRILKLKNTFFCVYAVAKCIFLL